MEREPECKHNNNQRKKEKKKPNPLLKLGTGFEVDYNFQSDHSRICEREMMRKKMKTTTKRTNLAVSHIGQSNQPIQSTFHSFP
jgi:hypothetical protein